MLLTEAVAERLPEARTPADWRSIGRTLATLHEVHADRFGLARNGYFGPLPQDNSPVASNRWADFYAERRLLPGLQIAGAAGRLTPGLAAGVERIAGRLPELCGPEPLPALLHGDAQQNNFLSTPAGAAVVDARALLRPAGKRPGNARHIRAGASACPHRLPGRAVH